MNSVKVIAAQALRVLQMDTPALFIPDAIKALQARYQFVGVPSAIDILSVDTKPLVFSHGKFSRATGNVVIQKLNIYVQGMSVETATGTDDGDAFLDDLLEWGSGALQLKFTPEVPRRVYINQLEFKLDVPFERAFPFTDNIGAKWVNRC